VSASGIMRASTVEAEIGDVEGRGLLAREGFSVAYLTSDRRKARKRERLYVGEYICMSFPSKGLVLGA